MGAFQLAKDELQYLSYSLVFVCSLPSLHKSSYWKILLASLATSQEELNSGFGSSPNCLLIW